MWIYDYLTSPVYLLSYLLSTRIENRVTFEPLGNFGVFVGGYLIDYFYVHFPIDDLPRAQFPPNGGGPLKPIYRSPCYNQKLAA